MESLDFLGLQHTKKQTGHSMIKKDENVALVCCATFHTKKLNKTSLINKYSEEYRNGKGTTASVGN